MSDITLEGMGVFLLYSVNSFGWEENKRKEGKGKELGAMSRE